MKKENLTYLFIMTAGVLWGAIGVTVRLLASFGLTSPQIVISRFFVVSAVFGLYILFTDKEKFRIKKADIKYFFLFGFFCVLFYNICFAISTQLNSLSIAVALLYTSPIWAMLLSIPLFNEKLTYRKCAAILLSFTGCSLMSGLFSGDPRRLSLLGLSAGLMAGIGYGGYGVFAKKFLQKYHSMTTMFYPFLFAGIGGLFFCEPVGMVRIIIDSPIVLIYIFAGSFICFVIPYWLYTYSLNFTEASRAAVIVSIEPVSATLIGLLVFDEPVTLVIAFGMTLILAAVFMLNKNTSGKTPDGTETAGYSKRLSQ